MPNLHFASNRGTTGPFLGYLAVFIILALLSAPMVRPTTVSGSQNDVTEVPQTVFVGTGTGAIPDGLSGTPPQYGTPLVISFNVAGITTNVSNVQVSFTADHTWVGDLDFVLKAPGAGPSAVVVSRIGVTTDGSFGSFSDYLGTYDFSDNAVGANIWTAAATSPIPAGSYRTTLGGATGQINPPPVTSLNSAFGGLTPAQANGIWTLTVRDAAQSDTGTVSAASLTINAAGPFLTPQHIVDYDGDGRTDPSIVRNTGGGPSGQITWFNLNSGGFPPLTSTPWGLVSDRLTPEDFDGDGKTDIAVWRPGAASNSFFYILQSQTGTFRADQFGQIGDDPSVVGDYDGDGKADPAVYRSGAASGDNSFWYYRSSITGVIIGNEFGQNGDSPAPGDYDGDGKFDFVVRRNGGGGQALFFLRQTTAGDTSLAFGQPTDVIVPGDYDGDGKYDIATARGSTGTIVWHIRRSSDGVINSFAFGLSATDFHCQGDWDGDGKTDIAVWRQNADPTQNFFFWRRSSDGTFAQVKWGQLSDIPVANYNAH